jgi:hypothetical protein
MPDFEKKQVRELITMDFEATEEEIQHGQQVYWANSCNRCHGGGGALPDLSYSSPAVYEAFEQIVGRGIFLGKGMPSFEEQMSEQDIRDLKHFLLNQAKDTRETYLGFSTVGVVGDALPGGWEDSHPLSPSEDEEGVWTGRVDLEKGEVKFRAENDWAYNWGGGAFPDGRLNPGGTNMEVRPGSYEVRLNLLTAEYSFTEVSE